MRGDKTGNTIRDRFPKPRVFIHCYFQTTLTEISEILHGSDLKPEDKIVRALEMKQRAEGITRLFRVGIFNQIISRQSFTPVLGM